MLRTGTKAASRQGDIANILNNLYNAVIKSENLSLDAENPNGEDIKYRSVKQGPLLDFLSGQPATESEAEEGGVLYREVDDDEAARLDAEPTVKVYRAMQMHDGKLYPPMSGRVREHYTTKNGTVRNRWVWRQPINLGKWEQSEEHPEMADKNGIFKLDKGNGKSVPAAYNPYIHTSRTPINDQFSSAWDRPELVTVEVEVPESELTSGYHAEKAKDSVGEVEWKSGPVGREIAKQGKPRMVILSRWDKPVRIVPVEEVADEYAKRLQGTGIVVPFNTVPPELREALVRKGVEIGEPEKGTAGEASRPSYEEWMKGRPREREGQGAYTDEELSEMNDPFIKMLGKGYRTPKQRAAFAQRERRNIELAVKDLASKMGLANVEVRHRGEETGRRSRAKGYFNPKTGKIVINVDNHRDIVDAIQTLLHEAVAHYGLRQLFGEHFNTFLQNVYKAADSDIRRKIAEMALHKYRGNFETATEEYLASLAEDMDFENMPSTFWSKIKHFFLDMLHSIGFKGFAEKYDDTLSDNELRYILWRSYQNLKNPGEYRSILGEAEDVAKQYELKVGEYDDTVKQEIPDEVEPAAEAAETKEEKVKRLAPRLVNTFKQWKNAKSNFEESFRKEPDSERASALWDEVQKWNDYMRAAKDVATDLNIDLLQILKDNGVSDREIEVYDTMFTSEPDPLKDSERRIRRNNLNRFIDQATALVTGQSEQESRAKRQQRERERKEEFKKICYNFLSGNFNSLTLRQIDKYIADATPKNPFGRRISQRVPQKWNEACMKDCERTLSMHYSVEYARAQSQRMAELVRKQEELRQQRKLRSKGGLRQQDTGTPK